MSPTLKIAKNSDIKTLRLILGDQLNGDHSWFKSADPQTMYVVAELPQEVDYVRHHIQKVCAFFAAMSEFAAGLEQQGFNVLHLTLDETKDFPALDSLLTYLIEHYGATQFEYQHPDEYRLAQQLEQLCKTLTIESSCVDSEHFLLPLVEIDQYLQPRKHNRMETFYRKMRKQFGILMNGDNPEGDQWNFDAENRNKLNAQALSQIPQPLVFNNDVSAIIDRIQTNKVDCFGVSSDSIAFPVNRQQATELLQFFCEHCLINFGRYQDAMTCQSDFDWSLYHSRLSFALNAKILSPMEVIEHAISAYRSEDGISIAQVEGFVRQILGWREFIRGIYWINMPEYEKGNALNANNSLPGYFWTAETKMNCMHHAIRNSLENAYAHHIQRLMVTGNFALLTGLQPDEVDDWYLGIYADAIQWVELPNTRGMAIHADDGIVGTKPYAASGNYINKMSDYCKGCRYKIGKKHGADSCPFNSLYWHFMDRHRPRFENNHRMRMLYRTWDRMDDDTRTAIVETADDYLTNLESL